MQQTDIASIVNLYDYPIADANEKQYRALVDRYRNELEKQQFCLLPGFLTEHARKTAIEQTLNLMSMGYRNTSTRNCYLQREKDSTVSSDHPKNTFFNASYTMLANDLLPDDFALKRLYQWPAMIRFVSDITGVKNLYVSADSYQPVNILCSGGGDRSAWHFDSWNAFTMTLLLQAPEAGGDFQLAPNIRSRDNPNYGELKKVLLGETENVTTVSREPGSLVIFRGSTSVHQVTEVQGDALRLMGVFVYENEPFITGDPQVNATVYGPRVTAG